MEEFGHWLGLIAVVINGLLVPVFTYSLIKFRKRNKWDVQTLLLLLSIAFLFPVFCYESLLFVDIFMFETRIHFSEPFLKTSFALGLIGIVFYNLQFLMLKDFPTIPISLIAVWTGIAIGGMTVALHLNPLDSQRPIYYDPLTGGLEFVAGQLAFNLIGYAVLILSILQQRKEQGFKIPKPLTLIGVGIYFLAPFFVILQRILQIILQPFNLLLLPYELGITLHLISYILHGEKASFTAEITLQSVSIIEIESQTVIAGYSNIQEEVWTKLSSMVVLATDSILKEIMNMTVTSEVGKYNMTYGDTIFVKSGDYIVFALFGGAGNKLGKFFFYKDGQSKGNSTPSE